MNRRLFFDFQKKTNDKKCKDYFFLPEPVFSVLHTKLLPQYFEGECVSDKRESTGLEPPALVQHLRSSSIPVQI